MNAPEEATKRAPTRATMLAPVLVALTPVLYHWGRNYGDSTFPFAASLLAAAMALAVLILLALMPVVPDRDARAAAASILVTFLLFYGYVFNAIWKRASIPMPWMLHVPLGGVLIGIAAAAVLGLRRTRWNLSRAMKTITLGMGMVCAMSAVQVARGASRERQNQALEAWKVARSKSQTPIPVAKAPADAGKPDIYFIILDGYAREDVLRTLYNFDNSEFMNGLRRRGFTVADKSCTNYPFTTLSLASSLNMTYLEGVGHNARDYDGNRRAIYSMIQGNRISRFLKSQGYRYATNLTHQKATELSLTADIAYSPTPLWMRGEFVDSLAASTAACLFRPSRVQLHHHSLESVKQAALLEGPKFVFSHILLPHPPYVFDRHGNATSAAYSGSNLETDDESKQSFVEQTIFVNGKALEIVDHLLKTSRMPPVIILQSDHGPSFREPRGAEYRNKDAWLRLVPERMPILNAFHVPEPVRKRLYPAITPVNTFRILLSELFGADLPLVEERCYFGRVDKGLELTDVTDQVLPR